MSARKHGPRTSCPLTTPDCVRPLESLAPSGFCKIKAGGTPARRPMSSPRLHTTGSVLVGLLWCVAVVSVVVMGVLRTSRLDLLVVKNHGDLIQAHYLALAGIEKAKALIYRDAKERKHSAQNH